jgi:hypothetical protein
LRGRLQVIGTDDQFWQFHLARDVEIDTLAHADFLDETKQAIRRAVLLIKRQAWIVHPADEVTDGARSD